MRLYAISERKELRRQVKWLPELDQIKIRLSGLAVGPNLESSLTDLLARLAFVENQSLLRTREEFERRREDRVERISIAVQDVAKWLNSLSEAYLKLRSDLESFSVTRFPETDHDVRSQMAGLFYPSFLSVTPWKWLQHYPRYLAAISYRLDKLRSGAGPRDDEGMKTMRQLWDRWQAMADEQDITPQRQANSEFRWMVEELRVSLFAQPLGTAVKVSPRRCEKLLSKN